MNIPPSFFFFFFRRDKGRGRGISRTIFISRHEGFSKETRLDRARVKIVIIMEVNTLCLYFDRKIKDLLRLTKGFIVVENFYEYARCKEKLLKEYKVWKESDCVRVVKFSFLVRSVWTDRN